MVSLFVQYERAEVVSHKQETSMYTVSKKKRH